LVPANVQGRKVGKLAATQYLLACSGTELPAVKKLSLCTQTPNSSRASCQRARVRGARDTGAGCGGVGRRAGGGGARGARALGTRTPLGPTLSLSPLGARRRAAPPRRRCSHKLESLKNPEGGSNHRRRWRRTGERTGAKVAHDTTPPPPAPTCDATRASGSRSSPEMLRVLEK